MTTARISIRSWTKGYSGENIITITPKKSKTTLTDQCTWDSSQSRSSIKQLINTFKWLMAAKWFWYTLEPLSTFRTSEGPSFHQFREQEKRHRDLKPTVVWQASLFGPPLEGCLAPNFNFAASLAAKPIYFESIRKVFAILRDSKTK